MSKIKWKTTRSSSSSPHHIVMHNSAQLFFATLFAAIGFALGIGLGVLWKSEGIDDPPILSRERTKKKLSPKRMYRSCTVEICLSDLESAVQAKEGEAIGRKVSISAHQDCLQLKLSIYGQVELILLNYVRQELKAE